MKGNPNYGTSGVNLPEFFKHQTPKILNFTTLPDVVGVGLVELRKLLFLECDSSEME